MTRKFATSCVYGTDQKKSGSARSLAITELRLRVFNYLPATTWWPLLWSYVQPEVALV
jgi:hypothetical protein